MEEQEFRRLPKKLSHALVHKFPSILEYKSPTSLDMPEVITELVEEPDPRGPFGAKEVGQGPLLPMMPAVANAVYDAVGVRIDEFPITPEKIVKALAEKKAGRDPRYGPAHFPHVQLARSAAGPSAVGRRRRQRHQRNLPRPRKTSPRERKGARAHDAAYRYSNSARRAPSRKPRAFWTAKSQCHAAGRRHRPAAQHEAAPASSANADEPSPQWNALNELELSQSGFRLRACLTLTDIAAGSALSQWIFRSAASGCSGGHAANPQHGHARRKHLPGYALQLLRSKLRVAEID